jgi:hypothetical protein
MINTLLFKHKTLGSAALRCGASSFGVKNLGSYSNYPSLFVAVFKSQEKVHNAQRRVFISRFCKALQVYTIRKNRF